MRRICVMSLLLAIVGPASALADTETIDFPCLKNLTDGRVLVDGTQWDSRMRELGYRLADGAYVPYEVLAFTFRRQQDQIWAEGLCRMKLLPVTK